MDDASRGRGWVRDKLIGRESDYTTSLDTMLGKDFAEKVNEYMREKGMETKGIGVIQSNPEQSKHSETATMRAGRVAGFGEFVAENYRRIASPGDGV